MIYTHSLDTKTRRKVSTPVCDPATKAQEDVARDVLGRVAGRWPLSVIRVLAADSEPMRFSRVLDAVEGITQKVLTQTLRHLERDGFVTRTIYPQVPPRVEYALTDLGRGLLVLVEPVIAWTRERASLFGAARQRFDRT